MAELSLYTLSQEMKNYLLLSGGSVTGLLKLKDVKIDGRINYDDGNNIINYNLSTIEIGKNDIYLYCDNLIGASKDSNNTIQNWTINKNGQGTFKSLIIDDITDDEVNGNKAVNKNYVDNKIEDLNIDEEYSGLKDLINQNKSDTDSAIQNLNNNLSKEITSRINADDFIDIQLGNLEEDLSNEIGRATNTEEDLQENINNLSDKLTLEITRAIESENTISERINSINELLIQKNDLLDEKIDDEITRATEAENNLWNDINSLVKCYSANVASYTIVDSDININITSKYSNYFKMYNALMILHFNSNWNTSSDLISTATIDNRTYNVESRSFNNSLEAKNFNDDYILCYLDNRNNKLFFIG